MKKKSANKRLICFLQDRVMHMRDEIMCDKVLVIPENPDHAWVNAIWIREKTYTFSNVFSLRLHQDTRYTNIEIDQFIKDAKKHYNAMRDYQRGLERGKA